MLGTMTVAGKSCSACMQESAARSGKLDDLSHGASGWQRHCTRDAGMRALLPQQDAHAHAVDLIW
jgi:hypothetical protein